MGVVFCGFSQYTTRETHFEAARVALSLIAVTDINAISWIRFAYATTTRRPT
jgi:hypothetical protein